ncbi:MAG TPA: hypothetical protein VK324_07660 [Tepidisphaeraceae bacterium]|nr:hypothetical protein [Tepidisphaeraceae bacterium]
MNPDTATPSTDAYRRDARRLRGRYAGQPHRLQPALRALAHREAAEPVRVRRRRDLVPPALLVGPGADAADAVRQFAALAKPIASGPVLSYADRGRLLATGERLGLSRFHANLVIAALRHEAGRGDETLRPTVVPPGNARVRAQWAATVLTLAAVQAVIVVAAWRLLTP